MTIGGIAVIYKHLNDIIHYPRQAMVLNIEGKVFGQFVVGKEVVLTDIYEIRVIGGALTKGFSGRPVSSLNGRQKNKEEEP